MRSSPVSAGVGDDDVVVLVDADDGAGRAETLEHAVRPAAVAVLQRLHDVQVQVDVHLTRPGDGRRREETGRAERRS